MSHANTAATMRELFRHDDWARDALLDAAARPSDEQLDQKFEMGCGTLRVTLCHIHEAKYWWLHVCAGNENPPEPPGHEPIAALRDRWHRAAEMRDAMIARESPELDRPISVHGRDGRLYSYPLRGILLHVVNHGMHHHAQALNMLRHLGSPPLRIDYIFMKLQQPDAPPLSSQFIREFFAYSDWAQARVLTAAAALNDEQLDRPFEMGLGTIRKTLSHIADAERWWHQNWTIGPEQLFPKPDERASLSDLRDSYEQAAAARNEFLSRLFDDDLSRIVRAQPVQDVFRAFPVGQTMLQLCNHGTHHRAQISNMLRRHGAEWPTLDYTILMRERANAAR